MYNPELERWEKKILNIPGDMLPKVVDMVMTEDGSGERGVDLGRVLSMDSPPLLVSAFARHINLVTDPEFTDYELGRIWMSIDTERAQEYFMKSLNRNEGPKGLALYSLGMSAVFENQYEKAKYYLSEALTSTNKRERSLVIYGIGVMFMRKGEFDSAVTCLELALPTTRYYFHRLQILSSLAYAHYRLGDIWKTVDNVCLLSQCFDQNKITNDAVGTWIRRLILEGHLEQADKLNEMCVCDSVVRQKNQQFMAIWRTLRFTESLVKRESPKDSDLLSVMMMVSPGFLDIGETGVSEK